ncbi:hypothetical protein [Hydrogenimonas sp. SS33]|uniref:hypothetical protein n=1 Tax=Hydrogenimonas leucolamina TaxID=2954236 RepID=UPI00336BD811
MNKQTEPEFTSMIKAKPMGGWVIELTETATGKTVICDTLDEYMEKIEELGMEYGPDMQVAWSVDPTVDKKIMDAYVLEIRGLMKRYQEETGVSEG